MPLDLAPQTESRVSEYAARQGVSADEAINRLLRFALPTPPVQSDDPVLQFLDAQIREAESATPEEIAEADAEWQDFKRSMNANREATGERLPYSQAQP